VIATANLPFRERTQVISNALLCNSLIDRITERAHIIKAGVESYRFRRTLEKHMAEPQIYHPRGSRWLATEKSRYLSADLEEPAVLRGRTENRAQPVFQFEVEFHY
jgi:hypothetical protein